MLRWMAPFLSFTAEEAWAVLAPGRSVSIFCETFVDAKPWRDDALLMKWARIRDIRDEANKRIEQRRSAGEIGASLQAKLTIRASEKLSQPVNLVANPVLSGSQTWDGNDYAVLSSLGDDIKFVFITSDVELVKSTDKQSAIEVEVASGKKCERCWHWRSDVGADPKHPSICGRCISNLFGAGEPRTIA